MALYLSLKKLMSQFYINLCKIVLKEGFVNLQCLPKRLGYKIMRFINHQSSIINVLKLYFILLRLWNYNFLQAYKYECFPLYQYMCYYAHSKLRKSERLISKCSEAHPCRCMWMAVLWLVELLP